MNKTKEDVCAFLARGPSYGECYSGGFYCYRRLHQLLKENSTLNVLHVNLIHYDDKMQINKNKVRREMEQNIFLALY